MFSRCKNFFCRHKRKFVIGSVVIGGVIFGLNYAQKKLIEWQERETREFLKKAQREHHYQCTLRTCNQTIHSLSGPLKDTIFRILNSEEILSRIRNGEGDRITLWEEMKVVVFAQIITLIYAGMMLVLFLRMQLNILGGYMIRGDGNVYTNNFQETYLSLCHHFLETGVQDLCNIIKNHSEVIMKDVSLKQKLSLGDIEQLFWKFDGRLRQDPLNPLKNLSYFLIQETDRSIVTKVEGSNRDEKELIKDVVKETVELLKFNEIQYIIKIIIKRAYSSIVDRVAEFYVPPVALGKEDAATLPDLNNSTLPLAKIVPILHGLFKNCSENGSRDPWMDEFIHNERLLTLGANIYEGFSNETPIFKD